MPIAHVAPSTDSKDHVIDVAGTCWCTPTAQREAEDAVTYIHKPTLPVVIGHTLNIKKITIDALGNVLSKVDPR